MSSRDQVAPGRPSWLHWLLLAWVVATAVFYFVRFTAVFIRANSGAFNALWERVTG